jgi:uroporphyrin-III C-methyltransferase/precorrin-2 dehydrogenase/sirohydrochlorin ferrochelatase
VEAGALVTVISPEISEAMHELGDTVSIVQREYANGDLAEAWVAHAATDNPAVNAAVAAEAHAERIWCVRADDHVASEAWTPASTTVDDVTIAVTSADPRRSVALRSSIAAQLRSGDLPVKARRAHAGHVVLIGGGPGDASSQGPRDVGAAMDRIFNPMIRAMRSEITLIRSTSMLPLANPANPAQPLT